MIKSITDNFSAMTKQMKDLFVKFLAEKSALLENDEAESTTNLEINETMKKRTEIWLNKNPILSNKECNYKKEELGFMKHEIPKVENNLHTSNKQQQMARQSIKTNLPMFDGKPEDWPLFLSTYQMTNELYGFSNIENLMRLRKCLNGEAFPVRHRLPNCVDEIIEELKNEFGRPSLIIHIQMDKIRKQKPPQAEDIESVIKFANSIWDLCAMEASGNAMYLCDPTMLSELTHKLSTMLYYEWVSYKLTLNNVSLSHFSQWISNKTKALKFDKLPTSTIKKILRNEHKRFINIHNQENPKMIEPNINDCKLCNQNFHQLKDCRVFIDMDIS